jgi:acetoin utilization deacetylase AcuC-like enzyme
MSRSAVVVDREFLKHDPGNFHPERPDRIRVLLELADGLDKQHFQILPAKAALRADIESCHSADYIALVESTAKSDQVALDGDTITCRQSFHVGLLAVGGFLRLLDSIATRENCNGFALVRPPGHHALKSRAMGFCLFNSIAIGARHLQRVHGVKRILILDWDVHHGNGTQEAFYDDPSVLFISTHQFPFYPGTGAVEETGTNQGEGYTINIPLPAGCGNVEYLRAFDDIVVPAAQEFMPEWILVSAGFDAHRHDPLGGMEVSEEGFAAMADRLLALGEEYANGRIAFLLEGGYDLAGLRNSVAAVLSREQCQNSTFELATSGGERIEPLIRRVRQIHEKHRKP